MLILIYILFSVALLLLIFDLFIYSALNKLFRFTEQKSSNLNVSVVVAAKNEAANIHRLISALLNQNYSKDNFEVIIVDDTSDDNTFIAATEATKEIDNFRIIKVEDKLYKGKRGALDIGIKAAKHPYLLITDADCEPEKEWINSFANSFEVGNDLLFGIAPYRVANSITNLIARFENLRSNIIVFAFAKLGLPYSASARSFGFSKEAFYKIDGYKNTTDTLSGDDDLLLREAIKNNLNIGMIINSDAFVFSNTKDKFTDYVNQKSRHTSTSIHYSLKNKLLLGSWHLFNLISLFSIFALPFGTEFIFPIFIKLVIDIFVLNNFQNNFGCKINPLWFVILQINYELNLIYFFLKGLNFSDRWE
ncbi:MAG: glycosyltransferase [Melioribacteraceae bacterium]|nr:glycosyltransferase [Melioribacteraceae bacterium]